MMLRGALGAILALTTVLTFGSGVARAEAEYQSVLERRGYWSVGRGHDDSSLCSASVPTKSKALFMITASGDDVGVIVMTERPQRQGRKGVFRTDAHAFSFTPTYGDKGDVLFVETDMSERALAALRLAESIGVEVDGRMVADLSLKDSGAEAALDAVLACGRGQSGWWGQGVDQTLVSSNEPPGVLSPEGYWRLLAEQDEGRCAAFASVQGRSLFVLTARAGEVSFGVATPSTLRPGKRGKFETDAWSFDFEPAYDENYVYLNDALNSRVLAALRLASTLNISVDGREIADMALEDTGVDGILDGLIDCSNGESGWWGEGLQLGPSPAASRPGVEGAAKGEAVAGGSGSAFFITPEGFAVTAAHVVEGCPAVDAPRWGAGRVVAVDRPADLAILKFAAGSGQVLALRGRGPRLGEPMSAGGFPLDGILGGGLKITTGVVSGLSGLQGDRGLFQISAPIQPGNSGGPVVDGSGALIGVVAAKLDELKVATATGMFPQNVNFAVPSPVLQAFLDENGLAYRSAPATPGPAVGLASVTFSITCQP